MAGLRGLSVKVPIMFSERAQRELYETCMAYKELAEVRGAENERLRELVKKLYECNGSCNRCVELMGKCEYEEQLREFGIEVDG